MEDSSMEDTQVLAALARTGVSLPPTQTYQEQEQEQEQEQMNTNNSISASAPQVATEELLALAQETIAASVGSPMVAKDVVRAFEQRTLLINSRTRTTFAYRDSDDNDKETTSLLKKEIAVVPHVLSGYDPSMPIHVFAATATAVGLHELAAKVCLAHLRNPYGDRLYSVLGPFLHTSKSVNSSPTRSRPPRLSQSSRDETQKQQQHSLVEDVVDDEGNDTEAVLRVAKGTIDVLTILIERVIPRLPTESKAQSAIDSVFKLLSSDDLMSPFNNLKSTPRITVAIGIVSQLTAMGVRDASAIGASYMTNQNQPGSPRSSSTSMRVSLRETLLSALETTRVRVAAIAHETASLKSQWANSNFHEPQNLALKNDSGFDINETIAAAVEPLTEKSRSRDPAPRKEDVLPKSTSKSSSLSQLTTEQMKEMSHPKEGESYQDRLSRMRKMAARRKSVNSTNADEEGSVTGEELASDEGVASSNAGSRQMTGSQPQFEYDDPNVATGSNAGWEENQRSVYNALGAAQARARARIPVVRSVRAGVEDGGSGEVGENVTLVAKMKGIIRILLQKFRTVVEGLLKPLGVDFGNLTNGNNFMFVFIVGFMIWRRIRSVKKLKQRTLITEKIKDYITAAKRNGESSVKIPKTLIDQSALIKDDIFDRFYNTFVSGFFQTLKMTFNSQSF